ncbi:transporter substrate-binding domain-containing protein [Streptococcus loxodontisalivarius]|uniref:Polar amino acid transport system substrate-binding protein n=1 Tax=Streptococcus loxodontisalivarius TaxID=1349415 RepID=A0ABS2PTR8_9STRE|nr:transporter substrate-binding domain-containing protein [Streptococcus loxodontisalivarius]MBM7643316.1 polar amino acid transport system substrate-binding protein [Streptococcus loxodontisalivarius]
MLNKKLTFGLVAFASLMTLSACGSSSQSENSLETIKEKGTLTVAMNPEFAPFEFKTLVDGKDTVVGADVEIAKAIGEELGVEVKFSTMSFNNVLAAVKSGKADIAISGISATEERQKVYDFSDTYYESKSVLIVQKAELSTYTDTDSFADKSIGTQKGSIQETIAKSNLSSAHIVSLTQPGEAINELKSGQVQGVVLEEAIAKGYVAKNDDLAIADISLKSDSTDAYAVAMPKGSDELKEAVNKVIKELKAEGKIDSFVQAVYEQSLETSE